MPPKGLTTDVSAVCVTEAGGIVLASAPNGRWAMPGGPPRGDESFDQTAAREAWDQARAAAADWGYLGAQQIIDPGNPSGPPETYRARYWLRVRLKPFQPLRPGQRRLMATFDGFLAALAWDNTLMAATVLEAAREMERIYRETMDATKG